MPPRLRSSNISSAVASCLPARPQPASQSARISREFSQSSCRQITLRRRKFYEWLNGPGRALKQPLPNSTNYLGAYDRYGNLVRAGAGFQAGRSAEKDKDTGKEPDAAVKEESEETPGGQEPDELDMAVRRQEEAEKKAKKGAKKGDRLPPETISDLRPFPLNKFFRSQPVLSEELREAIYQEATGEDPKSVPIISVQYGVSNERVGAVIRLKQMEKEWIAQGKTLAMPYAKAVLGMLPTTPLVDAPGQRQMVHEPINDLIVHPATRQQLFVPVAESRQFTRKDAGKAFDNKLLPADKRIPHPELVQTERDLVAGLSATERARLAQERFREAHEEKKRREDEKKQAELASLKKVPQRRWDFVFQDVSVESVGRNGRDPKGVGWRYGLPHQDRKKGQVKIPTKVEA